ncbi:hypothetical protein [uncultured Lamprocystis sp.]|jgi:hypothetical protein|uniref:hypothetical protein n=1 Tax=uncultured Lamprocystis sp. TaxID=543132 RepID=UPI0025DC5713|nr:hypothetical protein [uncultured Lamprocystis sp.]
MSAYSQMKVDPGFFRVMAKMAGNENLTLAEERLVADYLTGFSPQGAAQGLPGGPAGDVRGDNNLRRTNWFNGRYLTAEALSRQDTYFDARSRLNAHALMPGIAWGLGLAVDGANATPVLPNVDQNQRANGFPVNRQIALQRGLAFDHFGRPILVSQAFNFTVEQLIGTYRKTPQRVVGGGTEFAPCLCLAPDPAGPTSGGPAVPPGTYLLVIEAGETDEGGAKVMGEVCAGAAPVTCRADAWRGGFGLSLVRFPVELPLRPDLGTAWDLRGTLSAYYFDVFEHPLWRRWDPDFLADGVFCRDTGPGRHDAGAIALAMLHLAEDGTVLFLDQWIPRRTLCDTPAEDWHRTRFGAPPRAAAWARIHQFQCMLAEGLTREPLRPFRNDLYTRGFRHIPPIGFLPLRLDPQEDQGNNPDSNIGVTAFDEIFAMAGAGDFLVSPLVRRGMAEAARYFDNTNVITYGVVALHDDDILEDLGNVFDKDPIQVTRPHWTLDRSLYDRAQQPAALDTHKSTSAYKVLATNRFFATLEVLFRVLGLEHLVNRRTEIVKLVVPLQGLTRRHPLLGPIAADALPQGTAWGVNPAATAGGPLANLDPELFPEAAALAGIMQRLGLDMLPRHFVVYVKQRLVLLDLLFYVLELIQVLIEWVTLAGAIVKVGSGQNTAGDQAQIRAPQVQDYRRALAAQPAEKRAIMVAVLGRPEVQDTLVQAADLSGSELAVSSRNLAFRRDVAAVEAPLAFEIPDETLRRRTAVDRVADAYAAEYPDYQVMQILAAIQPPIQTLAVVDKLAIGRAAARQGTVADALTAAGPKVFADNDSRSLYADLRRTMGERKISDYVPDAKTELTAEAVLARSPAEAEALLGAETYKQFTAAFTTERAAATAGAEVLSKGVPTAVADALETEIRAGSTPAAAIEKVKAGTSIENQPLLDSAATVLRINGGNLAALQRIKRTPSR